MLNDIEQAKVNYLKISLQYLDDIDRDKNTVLDLIFYSTKYGFLLEKAKSYLLQYRPDIAIPTLLKYLKSVNKHSDSAVLAKIYLVEGYRKIGEFQKGIDIIMELLDAKISLYNRVFTLSIRM